MRRWGPGGTLFRPNIHEKRHENPPPAAIPLHFKRRQETSISVQNFPGRCPGPRGHSAGLVWRRSRLAPRCTASAARAAPPRPRAADAYRATLYSSGTGLAKTVRKPRRLPRPTGVSLLRFAERQPWARPFQPPPRLTRYEPLLGPVGSLVGDSV